MKFALTAPSLVPTFSSVIRVLLVLQCLAALTRGQVSQQQIDHWVDNSALTFTGRMTSLGSNVNGLDAKDGAMLVKVVEVKDSYPDVDKFGDLTGVELTVVADPLLGIQPPQQDLTVVFFVNPLFYDEHIAVSATAISEVPGKSDFFQRLDKSIKRKNEKPVKDAAESAVSVITGTVKEVRALPDSKLQALRNINNGHDFNSEHSPKWREAVIDVEKFLKNDTGDKTVIVVFPSTNDRSWAKSPRFAPGQTGTWLLHDNEVTKAEAAVLLQPEKVGERNIKAYTTLNPPDFQLRDSAGKNEALVNGFVKKPRR